MPKNIKKDKELDPKKVEIGKRIDIIRETEGWSKEDLAKILATTGQHVGKVIGGEVGFSAEKHIVLSDASGFSTDFILKGTMTSVNDEVKNLIKIAMKQSEMTYKTLKKIYTIIK